MSIFNEYTVNIKSNKAYLDRDVYLTRGDKNIDLYFNVKKLPFSFDTEDGNPSHFQIIIKKPNGAKKGLDKQTVSDGKIILTMTEDLIDEFDEVGDYSFQIILFDDSNSKVSLPIIYNQIHVSDTLESINDESSEVNKTAIDIGHVSIGDDVDIFNENKAYNKTVWNEGDVLKNSDMNKIENTLSYLLDNDVIYINETNNVLNLTLDKYQASTISDNTTIVLPSIEYVCSFNLFLKCKKDCVITFKSESDIQSIKVKSGYQNMKMYFIGDWIINC